MKTVKKNLGRTASKSTAVSCHWIRSRSRSQFLWVVGNKSKFDEQGVVPVNTTQEEGWINRKEYLWRNVQVIALLAGIAGLFHDFGKATRLFQNKLNSEIPTLSYEPYRHGWVSLRLFEAFVRAFTTCCSSDLEWLRALGEVNNSTEKKVMEQLVRDDPNTIEKPFAALPPVGKTVAWLVVSHHRLPMYSYSKKDEIGNIEPAYSKINGWLEDNFDSLWNSPSSFDEQWEETVRDNNWVFPNRTPFASAIWQIRARELGGKALECPELVQKGWLEQRFTAHLSRLSLMLAAHFYSSLPKPEPKWQDPNYKCSANTDQFRRCKQKLDEHNIGVCRNAYEFAKGMPFLRESLPTIPHKKKFTRNDHKSEAEKFRFGWQDKSYKTGQSNSGQRQ